MSDPTEAQVLAALEVLGWPDDRERSAHIEDDGTEVTPARHYWDLVTSVLDAAAAAFVPSLLPEGVTEAEFIERFRRAMDQPQRITVLPPTDDEREQAAYERGVAEGRRQATEAWERQWAVIGPVGPYPSPEPGACGRCGGTGVVHGPGANGNWTDQSCDCEEDLVVPCADEDEAYEVLGRWKAPGYQVASRLVGPWEPTEQDDLPPLNEDPVARRLGLFDADGNAVCKCPVGACCGHPTGQTGGDPR